MSLRPQGSIFKGVGRVTRTATALIGRISATRENKQIEERRVSSFRPVLGLCA